MESNAQAEALGGEAAAASAPSARNARPRRNNSLVWKYFDWATSAGGAASAVCRRCRQMLCAGARKGTSHLRRHLNTKRCEVLAADQLQRHRLQVVPPAAADPSRTGDQGVEHYSTVAADDEQDQVSVPRVVKCYDDLMAMGLVHIGGSDQGEATGDADNVRVCTEAAPHSSSSSSWFVQYSNK